MRLLNSAQAAAFGIPKTTFHYQVKKRRVPTTGDEDGDGRPLWPEEMLTAMRAGRDPDRKLETAEDAS